MSLLLFTSARGWCWYHFGRKGSIFLSFRQINHIFVRKDSIFRHIKRGCAGFDTSSVVFYMPVFRAYDQLFFISMY